MEEPGVFIVKPVVLVADEILYVNILMCIHILNVELRSLRRKSATCTPTLVILQKYASVMFTNFTAAMLVSRTSTANCEIS